MNEIEHLYREALEELPAVNSGFELSAESFVSERESEEMKLLFNLALMSLHQKVAHEDSVLTSDVRNISAEELQTVLVATEKALEIPAISLSALKDESARKISAMLSNEQSDAELLFRRHAKKIVKAGMISRISSSLTDAFIAAVLTAAIYLILLGTTFPELKEVIVNSELTSPAALPAISMYISLFLVVGIVYPLTSLLFFGATAGTSLSGIKIVSSDYGRASRKQVAARCLLIPVSVISFSILSLLSGGAPLHDRLSRTEIVK